MFNSSLLNEKYRKTMTEWLRAQKSNPNRDESIITDKELAEIEKEFNRQMRDNP